MNIKSFRIFDNDLDQSAINVYLSSNAIAVDTETMGLIPRRDRLCLVQICNEDEYISLVRVERGIESAPYLKQLMEATHVTKVFHYARFDVGILKYQLGINTSPIFCTKIASKLARTYTDKHGLREVVKELTQVDLDKSAQSSDWGNIQNLSEHQLQYATNDVRYLLAISKTLTQMLKREERYDLAIKCFDHIPTIVELDLLGYDNVFRH
ncbi:3'-5' exonuclease [Thalassoporum mexicanum PCC 7367]|uniref:ribonuclease H-like domain-containing protein n=1 Tax=Thalassoporum mexicanum TaxID=3457544 RepID=UPI00029FB169|nr:ribonuclease H-like domain-containing protein [Pseudanabaena sp. PCC 7367]AFY71059.1 3'-5' exonuclease [Pseudanabaena sp. PCC 7367]